MEWRVENGASPNHVRYLRDLSRIQIEAIIELAARIKSNPADFSDAAHRKCLLLLFQKTSTRTALSYQVAMNSMGGYSVVLDWATSNFSISPLEFEVQYASRDCDLLVARLRSHGDLLKLAENSVAPVVNGCDDRYHPSQVLADLLTMSEASGEIEGLTVCYVGVHNNVANGLVEAAHIMGFRLLLVTPERNAGMPPPELADWLSSGSRIEHRDSVLEASADADFMYTDTWIDMEFFHSPGHSEDNAARIESMMPYQLNAKSLGSATPWIMHPMPIHPGYEISAGLVESSNSLILPQSENRRYVQQALILHLLGVA